MNIGIDANCLLFEKAGIGQYTRHLLTNLLRIDRKNDYFLYFSFLHQRSQREKIIRDFLEKSAGSKVKIRILPLPAQWYEWLLATPLPITKLITDPLDVFFSPFAAGIPRNGFAKMVVTIHDLVFIRFPEHRGRKLSNYYLKRHKIALKNSKKVIVPSQATKKDLQDFLKVSPAKIKVIYEAADSRFRVIKKNSSPFKEALGRYFDPEIKYILSVGTLEPRKNLSKLVEAYSLLPLEFKQVYKLVLVGGKGWNNSRLLKTINNLNLRDKVILTGFVSDDDLPYIYNQASVFVYPSLYEGFGLPPLEAMACGTPVIASDDSSLPEVVNGAAILVDCQNEQAIAQAIKGVVLKPKLAKKLILRGIIQVKKFSWEKTAQETLKTLEEATRQK